MTSSKMVKALVRIFRWPDVNGSKDPGNNAMRFIINSLNMMAKKPDYSCQFIGVLPSLARISFVLEKWRHPKKAPRAKGDGCAASST